MLAVIGAGPAGLFAARELANQGAQVFILNRDIKPGGLAEYGIYPGKTKMKEGLRSQFQQLLNTPNIHYYGNLVIGLHGDLTLDDLRQMGFQALLVAVGAQGTKWLGIPGEDLRGVYHAKDLVYHYNLLPPYSEMEFPIGKRVAVIGVGNVMMDIAHWLLDEQKVDEVIAVARRGPAEVKFDKKELEAIVGYVDMPAMQMEIQRATPQMLDLGQDPDELRRTLAGLLEKQPPPRNGMSFRMQFLASPVRILGDTQGQVCGLEVEQTMLVRTATGDTVAHGMGLYQTLDVDTVIFAIGDQVDSSLGLPVKGTEFLKNPQPRYPIEGNSYEVFDPEKNQVIEDIFVAGWARKASTGLVGLARKDGTNGARALLQYLATLPPRPADVDGVTERLRALNKPLVSRDDLFRLQAVERERAAQLGLPDFKFEHNLEMLQVMGLVHPLVK
ncbi:MAG TPA: FAD-dependent oxidoreductase [Anaerolinea sp.]|nr:FAD-dependent oxidoreductase [Anaerolinea sp.]